MTGQGELYVTSENDSHSDKNTSETSDQEEIFASLDDCIDVKIKEEEEFFSLKDLIRGGPQTKKRKTADLKPIVYLRFNSRHAGKPKVVTLKALL